MNDKIYIFMGSKIDFETFIDTKIDADEPRTYFMELIKDYNANLRQEYAYRHGVIDVENLIVKCDDYASVYEHVIQNFISIVTTNHEVSRSYIHNPPQRIVDALNVSYHDNIEFVGTEYQKIGLPLLESIWASINEEIIGQDRAKKAILSNLYKLSKRQNSKPIVLLLLGASGIGKTEMAKAISKVLGGHLLRIQFSMMQTNEAYNYVFGAEHSKSSMAKDLMSRETNVILIDEFDKVHPTFYNAFYQMFDEGVFIDTNYKVILDNCIFICTSNFMSDKEAEKAIGAPIFSRFDDIIKFDFLTVNQKEKLLDRIYNDYIMQLTQEEVEIISGTDIYEWHKANLSRYENVRILRNRLEKAINETLVTKFIIDK